MKLAGIIAEYDPFHNGHAWQLAQARALGAERVAVAMSCGLTQRGALPLLPERVKLALPGQGALWESCQTLADTLGVASRVFFPGQAEDMPVWYAAADAAVSASRSEGLPFNIMEAMYCHLPVVASSVKGHTDLLRDGETGLLYPYGDEAAFAAQVRRMLDAPTETAARVERARQAVEQYALAAVLPQVMAAYLSAVPPAQ